MVLRPEDLHRRLDLGESADEVRGDGLDVRVGTSGAQWCALAESCVDDHPIEPAELGAEPREDNRDGLGVGHVECSGRHLRRRGGQLRSQGLEAVDTTGTQGQRPPCTGERAGHPLPQTGARATDQDLRSHHADESTGARPPHLSSFDIRRSARTFPPVWQVGQYWNERSVKDTSRTVSPHTGHGIPVRACTRSPERFSPFIVATS